jgi:hypothetical protein
MMFAKSRLATMFSTTLRAIAMCMVSTLFLAACGGGGGSSGTPSGASSSSSGSNTASAVPAYPTLSAELRTAADAPTTAIEATGYTLLKVMLRDPRGAVIANQVVSASGDAAKVIFPDGDSAITDVNGVATIKVARASLLVTGAGLITVAYDYKPGMISIYSGGVAPPSSASLVNNYIAYQVTTASVTLDAVNVGVGSLPAYGTRQISVLARINSVAATTTPVTVTFTASCGQVSPATVSTDSTGTALVTYSATDAPGTVSSSLGCSAKVVQITASSAGAAAVKTGTLQVDQAPATSMSFVSAAPSRIYLANSGGVRESLLTFRLLNQLGEGIPNQDVLLTMRSLTGGTAKAAFDTLGSVSSRTLTTDSSGKVTQSVYSGSVPTSVVVSAALISNPSIQTDSSILAIASGRPVPSRLSISLEKFAIEGFGVDGVESKVTLSMADRQGNPVPDGTAVNFVTEAGVMVPPTCFTAAGDSRCTVSIRSSGNRPSNGLVTIMAYAAGEEDFTDANGNNTYDCGEAFVDSPLAYRDDSMTNSLASPLGATFSVPRSAESSICRLSAAPDVSHGDGVWGAADVNKQQVIVFATSGALIAEQSVTPTALVYMVADGNGNSMPTGTTVAVTAVDTTPGNQLTCAVASGGSITVANSLLPMSTSADFTGCAIGDAFVVTVTSPLGTVTRRSIPVVP